MKVKVKIWTFASDTHHDGTESISFGSEAELLEHQKWVIEQDMENYCDDDDGGAVGEIRELLKEGKIEEAWERWEEDIRDPCSDTFSVGHTEVEIDFPQSLIGLPKAVLEPLEGVAGLCDEVARWITGDESYNPYTLAEALIKAGAELRALTAACKIEPTQAQA